MVISNHVVSLFVIVMAPRNDRTFATYVNLSEPNPKLSTTVMIIPAIYWIVNAM